MDMDVSDLAKAWDDSEEIRGRLRSGGSLIHADTKDKILVKTTSLNACVLEPVLGLMAKASNMVEEGKSPPSPAVEELREQVKELLEMSKREVEFTAIDKAAWTIRKFIAFLKLKIRKRDVSTEPLLHDIMVCVPAS